MLIASVYMKDARTGSYMDARSISRRSSLVVIIIIIYRPRGARYIKSKSVNEKQVSYI